MGVAAIGTLPLSTDHRLYQRDVTRKRLIITNEVLSNFFSYVHGDRQSEFKANCKHRCIARRKDNFFFFTHAGVARSKFSVYE